MITKLTFQGSEFKVFHASLLDDSMCAYWNSKPQILGKYSDSCGSNGR